MTGQDDEVEMNDEGGDSLTALLHARIDVLDARIDCLREHVKILRQAVEMHIAYGSGYSWDGFALAATKEEP